MGSKSRDLTGTRLAWRGTLLGLVLAHGLYLLPGGALRQVAAPFLAALLLLLVLTALWQPARRAVEASLRPLSRWEWALLAPVAALPLVAALRPLQLVVWSIGGGAALAVAWAVFCLVLVRRGDGAPRPLVRPVFFVACCCIWLSIVWDLGIGQLIVEGIRPPGFTWDRLQDGIFHVWRERPFVEHWLLATHTPADFDAGLVYTNHPAPLLLLWYLMTLPASLLGLPFASASMAVPFAYALLLTASTYCLLGFTPGIALEDRVADYLAVFLILGAVVTVPSFWHNFLEHNTDNVFPLAIYLVLAMSPLVLRGATDKPVFWLLALLVATLIPLLLAPLAVTCWFVLSPERRAAIPRRWLAVVAAVAVLSVAYPKVVAALLGYTDFASSLAFRTGLDGDTTFLTDAVQAVLAPLGEERSWWRLVYPSLLPAAFLMLAARQALRALPSSFASMATLLLTPYLFFVVLFPQAVSIHPYLFDYLLQLPALALAAAVALTPALRARLAGPLTLLAASVATTVIMAHLIRIAQFARMSLSAP